MGWVMKALVLARSVAAAIITKFGHLVNIASLL
jgi:hypothetical protein